MFIGGLRSNLLHNGGRGEKKKKEVGRREKREKKKEKKMKNFKNFNPCHRTLTLDSKYSMSGEALYSEMYYVVLVTTNYSACQTSSISCHLIKTAIVLTVKTRETSIMCWQLLK